MQLTLLNDTTGKKTLQHVAITDLSISPLNPRRTRPDRYIDALAERIHRNGYELTRALWTYCNDAGDYEVFAGGTRLEAAKRAAIMDIPIILHEGYSDEELILLGEQDNENDEYHTPVPIVDVWLSYKALADMGWTQDRIAKAKGIARSFVAMRLQLSDLPESVKTVFVNTPPLNERCALEIVKLSIVDILTSWLSRETAMLEIIQSVIQHPFTAKDFTKAVTKYNDLFQLADEYWQKFPTDWQQKFLEQLTLNTARRIAVVREIGDGILKSIADEKRHDEEETRIKADKAEQERVDAERAEHLIKERETWMQENITLIHSDMRTIGADIPDNSVDLIFTDPPYDEAAIELYGALAELGARVLKPGGSLITYAGHYALPQIFEAMNPHLRYWWIISLDHAGASARLPGKWVFVEWKPLLWFVKDSRKNKTYVADKFKSSPPDKALHEWQQDISEASYFIEQLTDPGDTVLDPFAGSGTTVIATVNGGRKAIAIDCEDRNISTIKERAYDFYTNRP